VAVRQKWAAKVWNFTRPKGYSRRTVKLTDMGADGADRGSTRLTVQDAKIPTNLRLAFEPEKGPIFEKKTDTSMKTKLMPIGRKLASAAIVLTGLAMSQTAIARNTDASPERSAAVVEAKQRLSELGYWIVKVDGRYDASTRHAIIAFQKVEGLKRTGVLDSRVIEALRSSSRPSARYGGEAHVEIDIARQVLFYVDETGQVARILPISSGSGERYFSEGKWQTAYTPLGEFKVTRQIKGTRKAPLGNIYYPSYFYEGWAIHGSNSIPVKPASHGCARIPRFAEKELSDMLHVGMPVYVYAK
jgi:lipoprotein-anchoring transpeptidase ErfK/SrfK